jgi:hypothetical protein
MSEVCDLPAAIGTAHPPHHHRMQEIQRNIAIA